MLDYKKLKCEIIKLPIINNIMNVHAQTDISLNSITLMLDLVITAYIKSKYYMHFNVTDHIYAVSLYMFINFLPATCFRSFGYENMHTVGFIKEANEFNTIKCPTKLFAGIPYIIVKVPFQIYKPFYLCKKLIYYKIIVNKDKTFNIKFFNYKIPRCHKFNVGDVFMGDDLKKVYELLSLHQLIIDKRPF